MIDHGTNTGAIIAVASPWWLPIVQHVSNGAAMALPILGVIWIVMQIISFLVRKNKSLEN